MNVNKEAEWKASMQAKLRKGFRPASLKDEKAMDMDEVVILPGKDYLVQTGVRVGVPKGWALLGVNKSGVATKKKLTLGAKLVDSGYTGELGIHLVNIGDAPAKICPGDKIAQFMLIPIGVTDVEEITEEEYWRRNGDSERGCGGFGSTGEK